MKTPKIDFSLEGMTEALRNATRLTPEEVKAAAERAKRRAAERDATPPQRRGSSESVLNALRQRVSVQHLDWIAKYGLSAVTRALEDFASGFENEKLEEIGTSDVSCWLKDIEKSLADRTEKGATPKQLFEDDNNQPQPRKNMKPTPYTGPYVGYTDIDAGLPCSGMKRTEGNVTMNENTDINWQTLTQLVEQERAILTLIDGLHFAWRGNTLLTCREDGSIPLNSKFIAEVDLGKIDEQWQRVIRALIAISPEVVRALGPLRSEIEAARFDGRLTTKGNDSTNMLSAYLLAAKKALEKFARACAPEDSSCTSK